MEKAKVLTDEQVKLWLQWQPADCVEDLTSQQIERYAQRDADHDYYSKQIEEIITIWEDYLYTPTLEFNTKYPEYADKRDDEIVDKLKAKYGVKN